MSRRVRLHFLEITAFTKVVGFNWKLQFPFPPQNPHKFPGNPRKTPIPGDNGAPAEMWEPEMWS